MQGCGSQVGHFGADVERVRPALRQRPAARWLALVLSAWLVGLPLGPAARFAAAQDPEQPDQPGPSEEAPESPDPAPSEPEAVPPAEEAVEAAEEEEDQADTEQLADEVEDEEEADMGPQIGLSVLGVASVVGGILFLLESGDSSDLADETEASGGPDDRVQDLRDRSDRESALGIVLTGLGVALIGAATYMWIRYFQDVDAPPDPDEPEVTFSPALLPDGAGFVLGGSF